MVAAKMQNGYLELHRNPHIHPTDHNSSRGLESFIAETVRNTAMDDLDKLFSLIDINNNGALGKNEVFGFLRCMWIGCEDENEKKATVFTTR